LAVVVWLFDVSRQIMRINADIALLEF